MGDADEERGNTNSCPNGVGRERGGEGLDNIKKILVLKPVPSLVVKAGE